VRPHRRREEQNRSASRHTVEFTMSAGQKLRSRHRNPSSEASSCCESLLEAFLRSLYPGLTGPKECECHRSVSQPFTSFSGSLKACSPELFTIHKELLTRQALSRCTYVMITITITNSQFDAAHLKHQGFDMQDRFEEAL